MLWNFQYVLYLLRKSKLFSTPSRPTWTIKGFSGSPLLYDTRLRINWNPIKYQTLGTWKWQMVCTSVLIAFHGTWIADGNFQNQHPCSKDKSCSLDINSRIELDKKLLHWQCSIKKYLCSDAIINSAKSYEITS